MLRFLGLSLGQSAEPSTLAVIERCDPLQPRDSGAGGRQRTASTSREPHSIPERPNNLQRIAGPTYQVRNLARLEERSYGDVVEYVRQLRAIPALVHARVVVDVSAVGAAVQNLVVGAGLGVILVTIHAGDRLNQDEHGGMWRLPRRDLAALLSLLLQSERLQVAAGLPLAKVLVRELAGFRAEPPQVGVGAYAARLQPDEDLALAVGLACWFAERISGVSADPSAVAGHDPFALTGSASRRADPFGW